MQNFNLSYKIQYTPEGKILVIYAKDYPLLATIEDNPIIMSYVLSILYKEKNIVKIIIKQLEEIVYYTETIKYLYEFVDIYRITQEFIVPSLYNYINTPLKIEIENIISLLSTSFLADPIGSYVKIKRIYRKLKILAKKFKTYETLILKITKILDQFFEYVRTKQIFKIIEPFLYGYKVGNRKIYSRLFLADVRPPFITIEFKGKIPNDAEIIDNYKLRKDTDVFIFRLPNTSYFYYYIFPPEYSLFAYEFEVLIEARELLLRHTPRNFSIDISRIQEIYENLSDKILEDVLNKKKIKLSNTRKKLIKEILKRYTVGFGILEIIALDDRISDIYINPPPGELPISVNHIDYDVCKTNIILSPKELESYATKFKLISGRPLDEANPVLDLELKLGDIRLRVAALTKPLSPFGYSFVLRRHRKKAWTLPLFIANKTINHYAAGLLSFLVDNGRSILIAGTRGSGKTSLLTALLLEISRKSRIITIEDTLEIPSHEFRRLGYDFLSLKVASPFSSGESEMTAEDGVRVSLRLGDSAIVLGEVRSSEAKTLYEAMRVGALANAVLGTIHAESPYGVYDRVVNDLGVPKTSFKATDIIVIVNPIKSPDGWKKYRRVLRITEVRKEWDKDPIKEKAFVDLAIYNPEKDNLEFTNDLLMGDSDVLKSVAARIKMLAGSWEKLWDSIIIRGESKKILVDYSIKYNKPSLLEANFVVNANDMLRQFTKEVIEEIGTIDKNMILDKYVKWIKSQI